MDWKNKKILFKYPTRQRPDVCIDLIKRYQSLMVNKEGYQFLVSLDSDDKSVDKSFIDSLSNMNNVVFSIKDGNGKVDAINRDVNETEYEYDILVLVSDDMKPVRNGFDMIIRKDMNRFFPDGDGVLWYNDGHQGSNLNTLCILGKKYYDRFGYIYHPSYISLYCDNEFMEVSKILGKYKYIDLVIIEHQHWAWGFGEMDELYKKNEKPIKKDQENFIKRKSVNYEL